MGGAIMPKKSPKSLREIQSGRTLGAVVMAALGDTGKATESAINEALYAALMHGMREVYLPRVGLLRVELSARKKVSTWDGDKRVTVKRPETLALSFYAFEEFRYLLQRFIGEYSTTEAPDAGLWKTERSKEWRRTQAHKRKG
jgi:hypothetical protein